MAVTIVPNSATIRITSKPAVSAPTIGATNVNFPGGGWLKAVGSVRFDVAPGDPTSGWFVGFIQAQWIETNWGYYRGQHNNDGSAFYQRARPPARPAQGCRDTLGPVTDIFYGTEPRFRATIPAGPYLAGHPVTVTAQHEDQPSDVFPMTVTNTLTHQPNYLSEAQLEFHFCTVLVVRDPAGVFHQLKSFYWNVHWQYCFHHHGFPPTAANTTITPVAKGIGAHVSPIYSGRVTDRRFAPLLTSPHETQSCNVFAANEENSPNIRLARTWANFDVRH
jgi:hypothetical protein